MCQSIQSCFRNGDQIEAVTQLGVVVRREDTAVVLRVEDGVLRAAESAEKIGRGRHAQPEAMRGPLVDLVQDDGRGYPIEYCGPAAQHGEFGSLDVALDEIGRRKFAVSDQIVQSLDLA